MNIRKLVFSEEVLTYIAPWFHSRPLLFALYEILAIAFSFVLVESYVRVLLGDATILYDEMKDIEYSCNRHQVEFLPRSRSSLYQ